MQMKTTYQDDRHARCKTPYFPPLPTASTSMDTSEIYHALKMHKKNFWLTWKKNINQKDVVLLL